MFPHKYRLSLDDLKTDKNFTSLNMSEFWTCQLFEKFRGMRG